ncbi:FHA domain-containing protein [Streptomyces sp. NPDC026672]|uniref:FHA domain-containing protein n=1 Tax=unclassified Streptomyces TaxID=2593676 RepID=UPI0033C0B411
MQIRLTVVDPLGPPPQRGRAASRDVLVTAPAGTALAAVASGLASAVAGDGGAGREAGGAQVVLYAGADRLDGGRCTLGEPPLVDGAVLSLGAPAAPEPHPELDDAPTQLHVVAGPDAGGVHLLHGGQVTIGRSADADVPLDDPDVSRLHCAVTVGPDGRVSVADLGSTNGTTLDGTRVGERPVRLAQGAFLRIGESALRLTPSGGPAARVATTPDGEGYVRVAPGADTDRDPGTGPASGADGGAEAGRAPTGPTAYGEGNQAPQGYGHGGVEPIVPVQGGAPRIESRDGVDGVPGPRGADDIRDTHAGRSGVLGRGGVLDPAAGGAGVPGAGAGDPYADGTAADGPSAPRKGIPPRDTDAPQGVRKRGGLGAWARKLAGGRGESAVPAAEAHDGVPLADLRRSPDTWPDPAALLLTALGPGPRLWERGPGHPEALTVRLGTADRAAPDGSGALPAVPVTADLREAGALGLAGPRARLSGLARAVLAQLAALHSPDALEIVLISADRTRSPEERTAEWSWLGWLPHVRPSHGQDCRLLLAYDREQAAARVEELLRRVDDHAARGRATRRTPGAEPQGASHPDHATPASGATAPHDAARGTTAAPRGAAPQGTPPYGTTATPHGSPPHGAQSYDAAQATPPHGTAQAPAPHGTPPHGAAPGSTPPAGATWAGSTPTGSAGFSARSGASSAGSGAAGRRPATADPAGPGLPESPRPSASAPGAPADGGHRPSWAQDGPVGALGFSGSYTVVVVDGDPGGGALRDAVARLAVEGPGAGVHVVCLAETEPASPVTSVARTYEAACAAAPTFRVCGAVALLGGDVATALHLVRVAPAGPVAPGTVAAVDAVSPAWAERFARALAPLRADGAGGERHPRVTAPLPQSARLLDELGLARATPASLMARWAAAADDGESPGGRAWAVLGAGPRGPLGADLVAEGPHLLIEGPPGSGRTELLRAVVASLAAAERPDRLGVVLIDGRDGVGTGGAHNEGLRACTDIPHVTTHLTANDPVRMREFAQSLSAELKRRSELLGRTGFAEWHTHHEVSGRIVAQRGTAGRPVPAGNGDLDSPPSSTLRLRPSAGARRQPETAPPPLPRLVVVVDDLDALVSPALGSPGRPAAGSVMRALEAVAKEGERLGVHLVAAAGVGGRTAETEPARRATLRITLDAPTPGPEEPAPGRGRLTSGDGRVTAFQAGRVTGRIPRTATQRPTVVALEWQRMGDPPARRPVRELGNGPTDLALLASAVERAAREVSAAEVPSLL